MSSPHQTSINAIKWGILHIDLRASISGLGLTVNDLILKISDFGLTDDLGHRISGQCTKEFSFHRLPNRLSVIMMYSILFHT